MAQDDIDRLQIAWVRLKAAVNNTLPDVRDRLWVARNRVTPKGGPGPKPS